MSKPFRTTRDAKLDINYFRFRSAKILLTGNPCHPSAPVFARSGYVRRPALPDYLPDHDRRRYSRAACVPEENTGNDPTGHRPRQSTAQTDQVTIMARSVFHDLFSAEEAAELEMRAKLLSGINKWLNKSGLTQTEAAEQLGVTQARVSEIKNGKINRFSLSMLVRLAQRARWRGRPSGRGRRLPSTRLRSRH